MRTDNPPSLSNLDSALAAGTARFLTSRVLAPEPFITASTRRFDRKLTNIFSALPDVKVGSQAITHKGTGMVFANTRFGTEDYLVGCNVVPGFTLQPGKPVEITTGTCIFGASSIIGYSGGATISLTKPHMLKTLHSPITDMAIDEQLHVYELETVVRLGSFINSLAARLQAPPIVYIHVPLPEYELYGFDLYARGLLNFELLTKYLTAVRSRGPIIKELFQKQLSVPPANLRFISPLDWVNSMDLLDIPPQEIPAAIVAAGRLQDRLWSHLIGDKPCETLLDLNYLSYTYAYLSQAQRAHSIGSQHVIVENPDEIRIYREAKGLQHVVGIDLEPVCGFYVHPEVVVNHTVLGSTDQVLYDCQDGTDPATIEFALRPYSTPSLDPAQ